MSTIVLAVLLVGTTPQLPLSVAATDDALAAFANPAGLGVGRQFDFYYLYSLRHGNLLVNSSFCAGIGPLGAYWEPRPSRWGVALGAGGGGFYSGVKLHRDSVSRWDAGALWRPANWLSVGAVWQDLGHSWGAVLTGIALRPLGSRYTLSGEAYVDDPTAPFLGLAAEPFDGIGLSGRVRLGATVNFTAGLTVGLGNFSLGAVRTHRPAEYGGYVRIGSETRRSLLPRAKCYLDVRLAQPVQDRKPGFSLMGPGAVRTTWRLLEMLHEAEEDASVRGLLLRLQGSAMSFAHAQELRAALASFRARGKKVVVHAHNLGMGGCYLASAADRVAVHPLADVSIPGISATTAFLKGTLEKLGIKAQPTRHGTYKSAVEAFTEDSLSPTNREQVEGLVRGMYTEWV
ncbi:hypothetical protein FJY71_04710, partial [candidate division WOR-3 bacterium]|nr:hypothetical protein [candidate division WOR-3 bacterium]